MAEIVALVSQKWTDLARAVAWEYGYDISEDQASYLLWNHTGFPSFWKGDPRESCTAQLRAYFEEGDSPDAA